MAINELSEMIEANVMFNVTFLYKFKHKDFKVESDWGVWSYLLGVMQKNLERDKDMISAEIIKIESIPCEKYPTKKLFKLH